MAFRKQAIIKLSTTIFTSFCTRILFLFYKSQRSHRYIFSLRIDFIFCLSFSKCSKNSSIVLGSEINKNLLSIIFRKSGNGETSDTRWFVFVQFSAVIVRNSTTTRNQRIYKMAFPTCFRNFQISKYSPLGPDKRLFERDVRNKQPHVQQANALV